MVAPPLRRHDAGPLSLNCDAAVDVHVGLQCQDEQCHASSCQHPPGLRGACSAASGLVYCWRNDALFVGPFSTIQVAHLEDNGCLLFCDFLDCVGINKCDENLICVCQIIVNEFVMYKCEVYNYQSTSDLFGFLEFYLLV